jgi:hypothetical protein
VTRSSPFELDSALSEIQQWLNRPENRNEVIFLDFEDATEQNENGADDPLLPHLQDHFEFGSGFRFGGPINGFQNSQLADEAGAATVWINVHDFDRDGN